MAASNLSSDVSGHRDNSGGASPTTLPRPDEGDNVCPVPLWEREFCHNAYDIPWETFCRNKWFIGLNKNVMDWEDSEAFKNFLDAKERFRAKYHGEPYEDPVLDPDMYIDEVDQPYCIQNNSNVHQQGVDPVHTSSGPARMLSSGIWIGGSGGGGARNWNVGGGGSGSGGGKNWNGGNGGGGNNGSGRNRKGGGGGDRNRNGGGGSGRGINWNCFGRCNQRNQTEEQHQQRYSGGMQRNPNEVQQQQQQQQRSGGRQQQSQRRTRWRLVPPPKDDPFARSRQGDRRWFVRAANVGLGCCWHKWCP